MKPSNRFAYLCLDNVKMFWNPHLYRTYFRTARNVETLSLAIRILFSIQIPRVFFDLANIQRGSCILLSVDFFVRLDPVRLDLTRY